MVECTLIAYSCTSCANVLLAVWASPKLYSLGLICWQRPVVAMFGRSITAPYVYRHLAWHCGKGCCILERCPALLAVCWLAGTVLDSLSATRCLLGCGVWVAHMLPHPAPLLYWYQNHWHMMVLAESLQKAFCRHHPVCWSL